MKILLVEDSRILRERLRALIGAIRGAIVVAEADAEADARERIDACRPDVVVLDLRLRAGSGLSVLEYLKASHPDVIVIVLTNYGHAEYRAKCLNLGADYFFDKSLDGLAQCLARRARRRHLPRHVGQRALGRRPTEARPEIGHGGALGTDTGRQD